MKNLKSLWLALAGYVLFPIQSNATVWRVNNNGFGAQFMEIENVNNADYVQAGDTIHLEGSEKSYGSAIYIRKRLVIIGTGYNLAENPNTSVSGLTSRVGSITFSAGSDGSQLWGVYVEAGGVSIDVSNVQVRRCMIENTIDLGNGISDIIITQNFFPSGKSYNSVIDPSYDFPTNTVFNNNIVQRPLVLLEHHTLTECNNNVFDVMTEMQGRPALNFKTGSFRNNIITKDLNVLINNGNNSNITNNIVGKFSTYANINDNIVVTDMTKLFVGTKNASSDGRYQLLPNAPAVGKGSDGADIGAFGGKSEYSRYVLSGLPPIPLVFSLSTTGTATQSGLPVTIKSKSIR